MDLQSWIDQKRGKNLQWKGRTTFDHVYLLITYKWAPYQDNGKNDQYYLMCLRLNIAFEN